MKRQGLMTTPFELRLLADELESQARILNLEINAIYNEQTKFQLNIVNKSGLSDTWEFEKEDNWHIELCDTYKQVTNHNEEEICLKCKSKSKEAYT